MIESLIEGAKAGVEERRRRLSLDELEERLGDAVERREPGRFREALERPGVSVIAEYKRSSPSVGTISTRELADQVRAYEAGGARALSILTDEPHFLGSLQDLEAARKLTDLPLLRKDFVVDRYQLVEAALAGADAALLIVRALGDEALEELLAETRRLGLDALVEVHSAGELNRALAAGADLIGINNRDLDSGRVDVATTFELAATIPAGVTKVGESGFSDAEQIERLAECGVDAVLVGETLMRADDPAAALAALGARI